MPLSTGGFGGGVGGFLLGPDQNTFTDTTQVAAEAARDAYAVANPTWLAAYDANSNLLIRIEFGGTVLYQQRIASAWNDVSGIVRGPAGPQGNPGTDGAPGQDGAGVDFTGIDDGAILQKVGSNVAASSLEETSTEVQSIKSLRAPDQNSYMLGNWVLDNGGSVIQITEQASDSVFFPIASELETGGSKRPDFIRFAAISDTPSVVAPVETFSGTTFQSNFASVNTGLASRYTFQANPAVGVSNCNLQIRLSSHTNDPPIFDWHRATGGTGFTLTSGTNQLDLPTPVFFEAGIMIYMTITGDGSTDLNIQGETVGGVTVPYLDIRGRIATREPTLSEGAEALEYIQDTSAAMLTGGTHQGLTVQYDDTNAVINLTVTGTTPPIAPDPALSAFSIDIPATVQVNTDLNVQHTVQFTTQGTNQITTLTLRVTTGDDITLTIPTTDGAHTQQVTLSGIDTSAAGTVTFQIFATTSAGTTIMSSTQTVTIRVAQADEFAYYGARPTNDFSTVDVAQLTSVDVQPPGSQYTITIPTFANGEVLGILEPTDRPISSIVETAFGQESLDRFTKTAGVRTINGQGYDLFTLVNSGPSGRIEFRVTHG